MKYIGAHVSISGGVENAPLNAQAIGATAFACFTKNPRQWFAPPISAKSAEKFRANCQSCGFKPEQILPHDSYLINLCQPDKDKLRQCRESFIEELRRCKFLGLDRLNFHPGNRFEQSISDAIALVGESVRIAVDEVPEITAVFEITAGHGSYIGNSFDELARMLEATDRPERVGICVDTCHAYAAGYDLKSAEGFEKTWDEFEQKIGFKYLKGLHINDSKSDCGGRLDRHHSLGEGKLGWEVFERIMKDLRFDNIPLILETIDENKWGAEIARLKSFCQQ